MRLSLSLLLPPAASHVAQILTPTAPPLLSPKIPTPLPAGSPVPAGGPAFPSRLPSTTSSDRLGASFMRLAESARAGFLSQANVRNILSGAVDQTVNGPLPLGISGDMVGVLNTPSLRQRILALAGMKDPQARADFQADIGRVFAQRASGDITDFKNLLANVEMVVAWNELGSKRGVVRGQQPKPDSLEQLRKDFQEFRRFRFGTERELLTEFLDQQSLTTTERSFAEAALSGIQTSLPSNPTAAITGMTSERAGDAQNVAALEELLKQSAKTLFGLPFFEALGKGELTPAQWREYGEIFYASTQLFMDNLITLRDRLAQAGPRYAALLNELNENISDELNSSPSHEVLRQRFFGALGLSAERMNEIRNDPASVIPNYAAGIRQLMDGPLDAHIGSLLAIEGLDEGLDIVRRGVRNLPQFSGSPTDPADLQAQQQANLEYITGHIEVDGEEHLPHLLEALAPLLRDTATRQAIQRGLTEHMRVERELFQEFWNRNGPQRPSSVGEPEGR